MEQYNCFFEVFLYGEGKLWLRAKEMNILGVIKLYNIIFQVSNFEIKISMFLIVTCPIF